MASAEFRNLEREAAIGCPTRLFIGGEWVEALSGETFPCISPSTGQVIAHVSRGGAEDIDRAVEAARAALSGSWSRLKPYDRQDLLLRIADAVDRRFDELSRIESLDMGAPLARTGAFRRWVHQTFRYYAARAVDISGETLENSVPGDFVCHTVKAPLGVVGGIIPWNGPLVSQLWSICPTLATGCALVLKPAEEAPLSALLMAEIMHDAGVPPGVINVVPGAGATAGAALAAHPGVDKIAFTGSTATGRKIIEASAVNMKRVSVELGGKSPDIVFADADLETAVAGAGMGCFNNTGQICYAGTRLLVQRPIYNEFVERLAAFGRTLRVGRSLDQNAQLGPLASEAHLERVMSFMALARDEGASLLSGGERLSGALEEGFFVPPTVFADARPDMRFVREEIFGPVIAAIPFEDEEEAISLANDTQYGLGGAVWTRDVGRAHRVSRALKCGLAWVNCYGVTDPATPFSGSKMSGYGVKGGPFHLDEYLSRKAVWTKID